MAAPKKTIAAPYISNPNVRLYGAAYAVYKRFCKNKLNGLAFTQFVRQAVAAYYASERERIENLNKIQNHGEGGC